MRAHSSLWSRKWVLTRDQTCRHLDLGLPGLQNCEKEVSVVCKPLGLWCVAMAAQVDLNSYLPALTAQAEYYWGPIYTAEPCERERMMHPGQGRETQGEWCRGCLAEQSQQLLSNKPGQITPPHCKMWSQESTKEEDRGLLNGDPRVEA